MAPTLPTPRRQAREQAYSYAQHAYELRSLPQVDDADLGELLRQLRGH
jgi:hypothetical protein